MISRLPAFSQQVCRHLNRSMAERPWPEGPEGPGPTALWTELTDDEEGQGGAMGCLDEMLGSYSSSLNDMYSILYIIYICIFYIYTYIYIYYIYV